MTRIRKGGIAVLKFALYGKIIFTNQFCKGE